MTEQRIIKKYPNRRLYDTAISSYITLEDVKRLVLEHVPLTVIDARTQNDITHNTLLQIIIEQEENGPPLFTNDVLQQMIRFYSGSVPGVFKQMFEQGVSLFNQYVSQHPQENVSPANMMADLAHKNLSTWQSFQEQWLKGFQNLVTPVKEATPAPEEKVDIKESN